MDDSVSRQAAIEAALTFIVEYCGAAFDEDMQKMLCERLDALPSAQPEPLTDTEQRVFLAAMSREEKVCKLVDEGCRDFSSPNEDSLVRICHEIMRKVKKVLWET